MDLKMLALTLLLLTGATTAPAQPADERAAASLLALRQIDEGVATVAHRLVSANADWCGAKAPISGIVLHHLSQYGRDFQPAAARTFGLGNAPGVLLVVPGSPGAAAGLQPDDIVVAVDGQPLGPAAGEVREAGTFAPVEAMTEMLEVALADGAADLLIRRQGAEQRVRLNAPLGCASRFQAVPSSRFRAAADGRYVQVTSALVLYAADDAELASILAHELAHNILQHRARLNEAGIQRGLLQHFGRNGRLTRATEVEADRLSLHLLARAGYDPAAAIRFWRRFGPEHGSNGIFAGTHPSWKQRLRILDAELATVRRDHSASGDQSRVRSR